MSPLTGHRYGRNFIRVGGGWREGGPDLEALSRYQKEFGLAFAPAS